MRNAARRPHREDEGESAFVSMTDMTVSFLFVIMILLAFFATKFGDTDTVPRKDYEQAIKDRNEARAEVERLNQLLQDLEIRVSELEEENERLRQQLRNPLERYLSQLADERRKLLLKLQSQLRIEFPELKVEISAESDALRFQGEGLFRTGESTLYEKQRLVVATIAARLDELLPCYTFGPAAHWEEACNPGGAIIEAIQIEGHTDSDGDPLNNLRLSTARANETFAAMLGARSDLTKHQNYKLQPVMSVAGYGQMRPVADNGTAEGKRTNRRIDLRIIMYTPAGSEEVDRIKESLRGLER